MKDINMKQCLSNNILKQAERNRFEVDNIHNCYRAILAIVNYLSSVCSPLNCMIEIYQDLTEVAYYIMVKDSDSVLKAIEQMSISISELENEIRSENREMNRIVNLTLNEIRTHLQYLHIQYKQNLI